LLEDFFKIIIDLKGIQRKGWKNKLTLENVESVADHSYSMTLMAMILSDIHGLDTKKIIKMALLHDLVEAVVGDFTPDEISKKKKLKLENIEMKKILSKLPDNLNDEYNKFWDEFQKYESKEAIFVHELDKLEMVFQAKKYLDDGIAKEKLQPFIDTANNEIKNVKLRELISDLLQ
jgi:putative hydrolases of HD superfamily